MRCSMLPKLLRLSFILIASTCIFIMGAIYGTSLRHTRRDSSAPDASAGSSQSMNSKAPSTFEQQARQSFSHAYNGTHLWSMRLADEKYNRVARLLPCRVLEYGRGPGPEKMDTCDPGTQQEFSIESTLRAQKWLYEHQHPADCSKKKIAILHQYAWSGFGSTIHQIVWAVGVALSQDRIVVYQTPGNWVSRSNPRPSRCDRPDRSSCTECVLSARPIVSSFRLAIVLFHPRWTAFKMCWWKRTSITGSILSIPPCSKIALSIGFVPNCSSTSCDTMVRP